MIGIGTVVKMFEKGSVCITGQRGRGKDLLIGNVIARRKKPYVSNLNYGGEGYEPLELCKLTMGENTYDDFIKGTLKEYHYPYKKGADIYISDVGVYLPSQYCNELNKKYPYLPTYVALSRQVSRNNIHFNTQNLNRAWDKLREQSDMYINCNWCKVLFGKIVIQSITIYDKAESCQARIKPCRIHIPLLCSPERRTQIEMYLDNFYNQHGMVKNMLLIYWNRAEYDTYAFEKMLGVTYEKE